MCYLWPPMLHGAGGASLRGHHNTREFQLKKHTEEGLGRDYGLGEGQWEVERATLEGRPKGHADEFEDKEG